MFILYIEPPHPVMQGDQIYRCIQPCELLGAYAHVVSGTWLHAAVHNMVYKADIVVFCQAFDIDFLPIISWRKKNNKISILEINDHFTALQPWNSVAYFYNNPVTQSLIMQMMQACDAVQFSSDYLQRQFSYLNNRCIVFHNNIWPVPHARQASNDETIHLGWGGSIGHRDDIAWILPVLKTCLTNNKHVHLHIMTDISLRYLFDSLPHNQYHFQPSGDLASYKNFLTKIDIGIAPILPTDFNMSRSDIKYLEFASAHVAAICSNMTPYKETVQHDISGMLFSNLDELENILSNLIKYPEKMKHLQNNAFDYVINHRLESQHIQQRFDFYQKLLKQNSLDATKSYNNIPFDVTETTIYNALTTKNPSSSILKSLESICKKNPHFYLPWMCLGLLQKKPTKAIEYISHAIKINPLSCHMYYLLGGLLQQYNQLDDAMRAFEQAIAIAPQFAPAHESMGCIYATMQNNHMAKHFYKLALEKNRFYYPPAMRLAEHHLAENNLLQARLLFEKAFQQAPHMKHVGAQIAKIHIQQGNIIAAKKLLAQIA